MLVSKINDLEILRMNIFENVVNGAFKDWNTILDFGCHSKVYSSASKNLEGPMLSCIKLLIASIKINNLKRHQTSWFTNEKHGSPTLNGLNEGPCECFH
jgi:hypothetical protein